MKKIVLFIIVATFTISTVAFITKPYSNWRELQKDTSAVLIARCVEAPEGWRITNGTFFENPSFGGIATSKMKAVAALKGTTIAPGTPFLLGSTFVPRQYEYYLIMVHEITGQGYQAFDDFRVIPMGLYFETNSISGKTPDEVVQYAMEGRVDRIKREIPALQAEQQRLEAALKEMKKQ